MTTRHHTAITTGESNAPSTLNTRLSGLDSAIGNLGNYPSAAAWLSSLSLADSAVVATLVQNVTDENVIVGAGEGVQFAAGARVWYLVNGVIEYNTVVAAASTVIELTTAPSGQINSGTLIGQLSESEYQAATAIKFGGPASPTLRDTVRYLERSANVKAFGAYGDGSSHLVGSGAALTAAQAAYPLTHAAYTITAADEHDWCAIQETILAANASNGDQQNVYIPPGRYKINRSLIVPKTPPTNGRSFVVTGSGYRALNTGTQIEATAAISMWRLPGLVTVQNMTLVGFSASNSASKAIRIGGTIANGDPFDSNNSILVTLEYLRFGEGHYDCIFSEYECDQLHVSKCVAFNTVGNSVIWHDNNYSANTISPTANMLIELCSFYSSINSASNSTTNRYGVYIVGTEASSIHKCVIAGFDHQLFFSSPISGVRNHGFKADGVHCEVNNQFRGAGTPVRRASSTAYSLNDFRIPTKNYSTGFIYKCTTAGTSAAVEPSAAINIRSTTYEWISSGSGTNEFYCRLSGGGNPNLSEPTTVWVNGVPATKTTAGSLDASRWGWGNNDSLGYNTIYIRLIDNTDPDTKASGWINISNTRTWPTIYGGTVTDGTAVWTAWRRLEGVHIDAVDNAIADGLQLDAFYMDYHLIAIHNRQTTRNSITLHTGDFRNHDTVYQQGANIANNQVRFVACVIRGNMKPYFEGSNGNIITATLLEHCVLSVDNIGLLSTDSQSISSFGMGDHRARLAERGVGSNTDLSWSEDRTIVASAALTVTVPALTWQGSYGPSIDQQSYGYRNRTFEIISATTGTVTISTTNTIYTAAGGTATSVNLTTRGTSLVLRLVNWGIGYVFLTV